MQFIKKRFIVLFLLLISPLAFYGCGDTSAEGSLENPSASQRNNACEQADVQVTLTERAWKYFPDRIEAKRGDCVEITLKTTDNGIGAGHGFAIEGFENDVFLNGATKGNPKKTLFVVDEPPGEYPFYCATQCSTDRRHTNMAGALIVRDRGSERTNTSESEDSKEHEENTRELSPTEKWEQISLPGRPPEISEELLSKGKNLYRTKFACYSCHGNAGRGNGPASAGLTNTKTGEKLSPRNFHTPENFKWGASKEDIARTILTGGQNPGSPMPPLQGAIKKDELWAVVSYVYEFRNQSEEEAQ